MFGKKKEEPKKELTDKQNHDINRIKALREYAHQVTTEHNFGRMSDEDYFKEMNQIEKEIEWMVNANAFDGLLGHPMKELEKIFP